MEKSYKNFGTLIRYHRLQKGLTHSQIAEALGLSRVSIVNIEMGRQRVLLKHAVELAILLEIDLNQLVNIQDSKSKELQHEI